VVSIGKPDAFQVGTSSRRRLAGIARHWPLNPCWASSSPVCRGLAVSDQDGSSRSAGTASPSRKMRLITAEKAFAFIRKLHGTRGCTVSFC
jgi:hypothetical protein